MRAWCAEYEFEGNFQPYYLIKLYILFYSGIYSGICFYYLTKLYILPVNVFIMSIRYT